MRMRNPKDKDEVLNGCDYYYEGSFDNNNPVCLEIGMGKGQFILNMALNNPNVNYIGVEKYSSVASVAIKKINEYKPSNLKVLIGDIASIEDLLDKKIDTIYLNFSDPWPKLRHNKRRLTSKIFLEKYEHIFKSNITKTIELRTDNEELFIYSLETLSTAGYHLSNITFDLNATTPERITTEYEDKFSERGNKIYYLKASK